MTDRCGSRRVWSVSLVDLGRAGLRLRTPLIVQIEDFGDGFVASWPEVEAFGSGSSEAEAINALKDAVSDLYGTLVAAPDETLGKLPWRWKQALHAVVVVRKGAEVIGDADHARATYQVGEWIDKNEEERP